MVSLTRKPDGSTPEPAPMHVHALGDIPMLDIGGDVGAIVARLTADTATSELFIQPEDAPEGRFHTGVHHRHLDEATLYIAVFPEVTEGRYQLLKDDGSVWTTVDVEGGAVTDVHLSPTGATPVSGS